MLDGRDVIAKAPTGTGENLRVWYPDHRVSGSEITDPQAVIICPTRELCVQIAEELRQLVAYRPDVRIAAVYGGQPIARQLAGS